MLDFKELSKDGNDFELLIRELLYRRGLEVYWTGKGPDGGKDLIFTERINGNFSLFEKRWVVQCKHNAHSGKAVSPGDIDSIINLCSSYNTTGYLLACTTCITSKLAEMLKNIDDNNSNFLSTAIWDATKIEMELLKPINWDIALTFFPKSLKDSGWQINSIEPGKWFVSYGGHIFYLIVRIAQNYIHSLQDIEKIIYHTNDLIVKLSEKCSYRIRAIFFDDKSFNYRVYADLLFPHNTSKEILESIKKEIDSIMYSAKGMGDFWLEYDLSIILYNGLSDRFDFDSQEYYEPYLNVFYVGAERKQNNIVVNCNDKYFLSEEEINTDFLLLVDMFKKFDFISVINSENATLEKLNLYQNEAGIVNSFISNTSCLGSFLKAAIRIQCDSLEQTHKLIDLISKLPQDAFKRIDLTRDYIYIPENGYEAEELFFNLYIYTNSPYINKQQYRLSINSYFRELSKALEKEYIG